MKFNPTIFFQALTIMAILFVTASCNPNKKKAKVIAGDDTINSGTIHISVDESFAPIIDSQIKVFMSLNPKAKIIAHYKPEADCQDDHHYPRAQ
jgi:phosphate transport system substrate-binding protein